MKKLLLAVIAAATVGTFVVLEWRREEVALAAKSLTVGAQEAKAQSAPPPPPECKVKQVEIDKHRSRRVILREPLMPTSTGHQDEDCELKTTPSAWTCWPPAGRVLIERCLGGGTP